MFRSDHTAPEQTSEQRYRFTECGVIDDLTLKLTHHYVRRAEKLDEISAVGPTTVCELKDGYYRSSVIRPEDYGLKGGTKEDLKGGTPEENAVITREILNGTIRGTRRNAVVLNAGAGIFVGGKADSLAEGIQMAERLIDNGSAFRKMEEYIAATNAL